MVWRGAANAAGESPVPSGVVIAYDNASVAEARAVLAHGIERRVPVLIVTGKGSAAGAVLHSLQERFGEQCDLALPANLPATVTELAVSVLRLLGRPFVDTGIAELLGVIRPALAERAASPRPLALLLDDAEWLPDDVLEMLGEFGAPDGGDRALLPVVLAGGPDLLARLSSPRFATLRRGLTIDVRLHVPTASAALVPLPPRTPVAPPRRTRRPRTLVLATLCGCLCGAAALYLEQLADAVGWRASAPARVWARSDPPRAMAATPAPHPPGTPSRELPGPTLPPRDATVDEARQAIVDFQHAIAIGDAETLRSLLAPEVRYNGVIGVDAALDDQIWLGRAAVRPRFLAPDVARSVEGGVRVEGPFRVPFRDVAGVRGEMAGRAVWQVARRADVLQIVEVEFEFVPTAAGSGDGG